MEISYQFVAFAALVCIGVVMLNGILSPQNDSLNALNNYSLNFTQNPQLGSTLVIDNQVFEFTNNSALSDGNIPVLVDSDVNVTAVNLKQAITNHTSLVVT
jgi:hypothetical protein